MPDELATVFLWNDSRPVKTLVAATASTDSVEIYYAVENKFLRHGGSCTVSSHTWYGQGRRYLVEEYTAVD
jgi:hypothetical protein